MNYLPSELGGKESVYGDVMVDRRIKDSHYTEIIRAGLVERRLN
jgi:hypothetical protein